MALYLFQYAELLADLCKGIDGAIQMLLVVSSTDLHSYSCLAFGNNREEEADDIDSLLKKSIREFGR